MRDEWGRALYSGKHDRVTGDPDWDEEDPDAGWTDEDEEDEGTDSEDDDSEEEGEGDPRVEYRVNFRKDTTETEAHQAMEGFGFSGIRTADVGGRTVAWGTGDPEDVEGPLDEDERVVKYWET